MHTLGHHENKHTIEEISCTDELAQAFEFSKMPVFQRLANFPNFVRRQALSRFLAKYEIFKMVLDTHGSIVECGVFAGGGLMGWLHLSSILEPYNHNRRIFGFDTFEGFPDVSSQDTSGGESSHLHTGGLKVEQVLFEEIQNLAAIHDRNRPIGHVSKIDLIKGDACVTIPEFVAENPHLVISLLYLDFDIYAPTLTALEEFLPRMPKGAIVAFDELNCKEFPGETVAMLEKMNLGNASLRRTQLDPHISYIRL
jgi:hypothetical protein